ncbi:uncharacterized protein F5Z01DRAFT_675888 [Emericellopsis atlantica]|uniref:Fatty acid desaturase domain-containing protein n=1 Tax=Emericellopsis atlantica TaxID=2614577 RepID=A0A9P8CMR9_9HYPO|nr:uncharacterized protein F5Z01DRAFT_675888 [Emericellopsis atlantica]KAG9252402.1 hypothetical protein F5Z01DRAFT_675888 [Emericellopsis atlantica]
MADIFYDPNLTQADRLVLECLEGDIKTRVERTDADRQHEDRADDLDRQNTTIATLSALNDPKSAHFVPTVVNGRDLHTQPLPKWVNRWLLQPYVRLAQSVVRHETDVVMFSHLLLYFTTSVPSALFLFWHFTWIHGIAHTIMQLSYVGTYTLMQHQHIHQRGILNKRFSLFDAVYPYITDPLMGHSWNSYYYHHVKHHHVEGNGPDDLSSTLRYQRDNVWHFLHYVGRFYVLIWLDLPRYFLSKGKTGLALKAASWEFTWYATLATLLRLNKHATIFVFLVPFLLLRVGLMVGNWGQHCFVDFDEPDSDYRSSITLIDVPSNRHCFNDGYHTSHHLNPLRHWRDHPLAFVKGKDLYASQHALTFHNIDYIMITVRVLTKNYRALAECLVPMGDQIAMTMEERMAMLESHTRQFTEDDIRRKFPSKGQ